MNERERGREREKDIIEREREREKLRKKDKMVICLFANKVLVSTFLSRFLPRVEMCLKEMASGPTNPKIRTKGREEKLVIRIDQNSLIKVSCHFRCIARGPHKIQNGHQPTHAQPTSTSTVFRLQNCVTTATKILNQWSIVTCFKM